MFDINQEHIDPQTGLTRFLGRKKHSIYFIDTRNKYIFR